MHTASCIPKRVAGMSKTSDEWDLGSRSENDDTSVPLPSKK